MKTLYKSIILLVVAVCLSNCEMGLEELPYSDACEISSFSFERRWVEQEARTVTDADGEVIVYYIDKVMFEDVPNIALSIAETQVDVVVPAATDLSNIVGLATISVGATIIPLEGSPKLGVRADFTQPRKYRIIASDGMTARDYTIIARKE